PNCGRELPNAADAYCPNCHQPLGTSDYPQVPDPPTTRKRFTTEQRMFINRLAARGPSGPTFKSLCRRAAPNWFFILASAGIFTWVLVAQGQDQLGFNTIGYALGILAHDFVTIFQTLSRWPVVAAVTDWSRVEALSREDDIDPGQHGSA